MGCLHCLCCNFFRHDTSQQEKHSWQNGRGPSSELLWTSLGGFLPFSPTPSSKLKKQKNLNLASIHLMTACYVEDLIDFKGNGTTLYSLLNCKMTDSLFPKSVWINDVICMNLWPFHNAVSTVDINSNLHYANDANRWSKNFQLWHCINYIKYGNYIHFNLTNIWIWQFNIWIKVFFPCHLK